MPDPSFLTVPLDQLEISDANVRRTPAAETAFVELKASIAAHGLQHNLVARAIGPDSQGKPRYAVIAGGRRLTALTELADDGVLPHDHPVLCRVVSNGAADAEISLAENTVRVAMHPADQVQAFGALAIAGATVADIAARFGVSERIVEQRLRLGHAAPELLDAYRADQIDLASLKAFAVTTDTARQLAAWDQIKDQGYRASDWQIKRLLTDDRLPAGSALVRFVGIDTYEAAGGPVLRDLFADEYENGVWIEDPVLLNKLAMDRLQVAADELSTRWKWAEARVDVDWSDLASFGRVRPTPAEPTEGEKAEIEQLHVRHDQLVNMDEDQWTDELIEESELIEPRLAEIDTAIKARAVFKPEDMTIAGCIVTVGNDATLQVVQGLVKPEDMPSEEAATATGASGQDAATGAGGNGAASGMQSSRVTGPTLPGARPDPEVEARKEAGVGIGLADDLRACRTTLVKAHLAGDFPAAFDLMLFQMVRAIFTPGYHDHALDIAVRETANRPPLRINDDTYGDFNTGEAMLEDRSSLSFDWLEIEDRQESFAALRALPEADKQRLFAACVARTLNGQLAFEASARPETEATVARLDIDFATHVRPTAGMFWSRVRKDRMLSVAQKVLGLEWAHSHRKDKKGTLAGAMETAFAKADAPPLGVTKEGHAAALAWAPPGFAAFDTGHVEDDDADQASAGAESDGKENAATAQPDADAGTAAPAEDPADTGHEEQPVPAESTAPAETPVSPDADGTEDATPTVQDAIDLANAVPVAGGGPRVIVSTVGFETPAGDTGDSPTDDAPPAPPVPGNGHDPAANGAADPLALPAFLRRS